MARVVDFSKPQFKSTTWSDYPDIDAIEEYASECKKFLRKHPSNDNQDFLESLKSHLENKTAGLPECCESFINAANEVWRLYKTTCAPSKLPPLFTNSPLGFAAAYSQVFNKTDPSEIATAFRCDILESIKKSETTPKNHKPSEDIVKAFEETFIDDTGMLERLMGDVRQMAGKWNRSTYYSPYTSFLQSSGSGKTRSVVKFGEQCWLFFVCFRQPGSTGYPQRSFAADYLTTYGYQFVEKNLGGDQKKSLLGGSPETVYKLYYTAVWIACVESLHKDLKKTKLKELKDHYMHWTNKQLEVDGETNEIGKTFWTGILSRAIGILNSLKVNGTEEAEKKLEEQMKSTYLDFEGKLATHRFTKKSKTPPLLLFALDEASELVKGVKSLNLLESFRQAFSYVPDVCVSKLLTFSILVDTCNSIVLSSTIKQSHIEDRSKRSVGERRLFRPIWLLSNWNIRVEQEEPNLLSDEPNRAQWSSDLQKFAKLCGRPMWRGYSDYLTMRKVALEKLIGGLDSSLVEQGKVSCSTEMAMALLGCRFALNFHAFASFVPTLCASHMATCLFIHQNPEHIVAGYPSEPVLAEASARATHRYDAFRIDILLEHLISQVKQGVVEAGYRGELVAKIILLLARDLAVVGGETPATANDSTTSVIDACTVQQYLDTLCGKETVAKYLKAECPVQDFQAFLQGHVYFTHFVYIVYTPTLEQMKKFFMRGAAIFCRRMQQGIDCIIPVFLHNDHWSYILVSVKNYCSNSNESSLAPTKSNAAKAGINEPESYPYLLLFMDVGPELKCKVERPGNFSRAHLKRGAQSYSSEGLPVTLAITGLSRAVYPFLDKYSNLEEKLKRLANSWIEPLDLLDTVAEWREVDKKKGDLKRIMMLTYQDDNNTLQQQQQQQQSVAITQSSSSAVSSSTAVITHAPASSSSSRRKRPRNE